MITDDPAVHKQVLDEIARLVPDLSLTASPPQIAHAIHTMIRQHAPDFDPYRTIKERSNRQALAWLPRIRCDVQSADDPLERALRYAIAGNVIDFGPQHSFDLDQELSSAATQTFGIFDYSEFQKAVRKADNVLYLGDNAGEIVFDKLLIETMDKPTTFVVRGGPVINDATTVDAKAVGLDQVAEVMDNGSIAPGTLLDDCSNDFLNRFWKADCVIAKGQGNYESLSEADRPIFFLFKAKCHVIANDAGVEVGDFVLKSGGV